MADDIQYRVTAKVIRDAAIGSLEFSLIDETAGELKQRVDHYLFDHPDDPPPRECLNLIMICIATLDGARAVGFDVGDLEGELEKSLAEVERRAG